ncbi:putative ATPase, AAA-type, core, P-loop containing nucleoside triphosphate hydrolase [Helianthus annuus]|nr:putative ATPase, AAA-type, core, P-loop containing nucleoside triphosphate hydrolase [Helianthus annuus]
MMEVNRREKEGGIIPDPDIDTFIKWRREVAFAGFDVAIQMDIFAEKMSFGVSGVLDIDLSWRMHKISDGQRRRVQICMGLLKEFKVLLLDEITVDLDVLARADLLTFLKKKCEERGATIIYATHII